MLRRRGNTKEEVQNIMKKDEKKRRQTEIQPKRGGEEQERISRNMRRV
jgi:hypothetical protein